MMRCAGWKWKGYNTVRIRDTLHRRMIEFDEWLCSRLKPPRSYRLERDDEAADVIEDLLTRLRSKRGLAHYDNGLPVPRSLFFSSFAVLLLSDNGALRKLVRTPYLYGSSREILVKRTDTEKPWGALAKRDR